MDRKWTGSNPNPILCRRPYDQRICPCAVN
jgi:hypothetical protein